MRTTLCLQLKDLSLHPWRRSIKSFSQSRVKQSPHSQTLSLVLGSSNNALNICEAPWELTVKLLTLKKRLLGGNPIFIYLTIFFLVICLYRFMIMWNHKINKKIENGIKNSRRKITPWRKHLSGVQRQNRAWFWRWTPRTSMVLAFNTKNGQQMGVERPKWAPTWRWTPRVVCKGILHA